MAPKHYVKLDNTAVAIESASCIADALEFVLCFWVFGVAYPEDLKTVLYSFTETMLGM